MTLVRLKSITCFVIPLMLAFASGDAAVASPAQSGQRVYVDGQDMPVELPVVFPPVKKIVPKPPKPTEQELRTRAETGDVDAMLAYGDFLSTPSDFPWYLKAAEGGSPKAMMIVANRAREGKTGSGIDLALSEKWLNKALQTGGQALGRQDINVLKLLLDGDQYGTGGNGGLLGAPTEMQYALAIGRAGGFEIDDIFGSVIHVFPNTSEKVQLLEKCSNDAHPWCTEQLAYGYLNGDSGLIIDHSLGIKLLTRVAQAGYQIDFFANLQSLSQAEKIQFWKTAIEHGALGYTELLAGVYRDGDGVPKSAPIAAALLETLIQRPDADSSYRTNAIVALARMYVDGKSFPPNDQFFLHALNLASSLSTEDQASIAICFVDCSPGRLNEATLNLSASTRLLLLKSVVEERPPFDLGTAIGTYYRYLAALRLGDLYSSGQQNVKQSYIDAMTWYQKAEQIGTVAADRDFIYDGVSAVKIGLLYEKGLGVPNDSSIAISWYQKAVNNLMSQINDSTNAYNDLSMSNLIQVLNSIPLQHVQVISFIRASAETGNGQTQYYLGKMYYEGKYVPQSYSEAAGWFEKCGNSNSPWAESDCLGTLGKMYLQGQGVARDPAKAAYYYQRLADIGGLNPWRADSSVMDILLPMYCGGEEIPMDRPKAFALFKKGADGDVAFDELGVGTMYQMGWGVQQDLAEAFNWYRKAAADKNYSSAKAKADFTRIFRDCKGTPENFNAAVTLYDKASGGQH